MPGNSVNYANDYLYLDGSLDNSVADNPVSGGVLNLDASTGPLYLQGGTIYQGTVNTSGSDDLVGTSYSANWLDGITLNGTLDMSQGDNGATYYSESAWLSTAPSSWAATLVTCT